MRSLKLKFGLLFASLAALLAVGLVSLIVFTARGGEPPRAFIWLLLIWVVALSGVVLVLERRLARAG